MKIINLWPLFLLLFVSIAGCKKGDTGPAGADGNADVNAFTFGPVTFTGTTNLKLTGLTQGRIDSSLILVYYNPVPEAATSWYPAPGLGSGANYETRYFIYQTGTNPVEYTLSLRLMNTGTAISYPTQVTFTKIKVFIVPASKITPGGRTGNTKQPVDLNNYYDVCRFYGIPTE